MNYRLHKTLEDIIEKALDIPKDILNLIERQKEIDDIMNNQRQTLEGKVWSLREKLQVIYGNCIALGLKQFYIGKKYLANAIRNLKVR